MDAAVAATMVTGVVDYGKTSFAGGGQLTYWEARTGRAVVINHEPNAVREDVRPYSREREAQTGRSIRVPGSTAGFHLAVEKYSAVDHRNAAGDVRGRAPLHRRRRVRPKARRAPDVKGLRPFEV
jgi:gamma-glutamyltranspeptidase